jgi:C1A family cysteine protease
VSAQSPGSAAIADAKTRVLTGLRQLKPAFTALEDALKTGVPVVAVMDWYSNSYLAPVGRIETPKAGDRLLGRHAILLVEVEDESRIGEHSIVFKNSWGVKWGDQGFGSFGVDYFRLYARELWSLTS